MSPKPPTGRTTHRSLYSPGGEAPHVLGTTWLESESFCYPAGGFTRRAYVELQHNTYNPDGIPADLIGRRYVVSCAIPDTYFSIPARLRVRVGKRQETIRGFVSVQDSGTETARYTFTANGLPIHSYEMTDGGYVDAAQALYWYCVDYHTGQWSELYAIQCKLQYRPGAAERGPAKGIAREIYQDLKRKETDPQELLAKIQAAHAAQREV